MIENNLLISVIISSVITIIYYYLYKNNENNENNENNTDIGPYLIVFISILIITYLVQIGYFPDKKSSKNIDLDISGGEYKPPF